MGLNREEQSIADRFFDQLLADGVMVCIGMDEFGKEIYMLAEEAKRLGYETIPSREAEPLEPSNGRDY
jgi:hypothetical protein